MHDRKWQYKVETIKINIFQNAQKQDKLIQERLTRLGMEGWELVAVLQASNAYPRLYLKR